MLLEWALFIFVALVAKFILALITIYLLLPADRRCSQCDGETLLLRPRRLGRVGAAAAFGLLQWRWCPRCEWEGLCRRVASEPADPSTASTDLSAPTRRRRVP